MFLYLRHSGYSRSCLYGLLLGCLLGLMGQVHAQDDSNPCEDRYAYANSKALGHICLAYSSDSEITYTNILYYPYGASSEYVQEVPKTFLARYDERCPVPYNIYKTASGNEVCMKYVMHHQEEGFICQTFEPHGLTVMSCESLILDNSQ